MPSKLTFPAGAPGLKARLESLEAERAQAALSGLKGNALYSIHLEQELAATRAAYVGAAVTEIASLRAAMDGPLEG